MDAIVLSQADCQWTLKASGKDRAVGKETHTRTALPISTSPTKHWDKLVGAVLVSTWSKEGKGTNGAER